MPHSELAPIESKVRRAIEVFLERDAALIRLGVKEETISHRIAVYLECAFPYHNVDCEYNKYGEEGAKKFYDNLPTPRRPEDPESMRPDIVVHHRGNQSDNLLVIEIKRGTSPGSWCRRKLERFTSGSRETTYYYGYKAGAFIGFRRNGEYPKVVWFQHGEMKNGSEGPVDGQGSPLLG